MARKLIHAADSVRSACGSRWLTKPYRCIIGRNDRLTITLVDLSFPRRLRSRCHSRLELERRGGPAKHPGRQQHEDRPDQRYPERRALRRRVDRAIPHEIRQAPHHRIDDHGGAPRRLGVHLLRRPESTPPARAIGSGSNFSRDVSRTQCTGEIQAGEKGRINSFFVPGWGRIESNEARGVVPARHYRTSFQRQEVTESTGLLKLSFQVKLNYEAGVTTRVDVGMLDFFFLFSFLSFFFLFFSPFFSPFFFSSFFRGFMMQLVPGDFERPQLSWRQHWECYFNILLFFLSSLGICQNAPIPSDDSALR